VDPLSVIVLVAIGAVAIGFAPELWEKLRDWISALWSPLQLAMERRADRILPPALPSGREALPAHDHLEPEDVLWLVRQDWVPPQATVDRLKTQAAKLNADLEAAHRARQRREEAREAREDLERWRARSAEMAVKTPLTTDLDRLKSDAVKIRKELQAERQRVAELEAKLQRDLGVPHREAVYVAGRRDPIYYLD